jgi:hypothetical protein
MPAVLKDEVSYDIQLVAVCQDKTSGIPTFCENDLIWLLGPGLTPDTKTDLMIGVALSISMDSRSNVLALCYKRRLLMLKLPDSDDDLEKTEHPGLNVLDGILLGSTPAGIDSSSIAYEVTKDRQNIKVTNEQYKYKLAFNSRQHLKISLKDEAGETHTFTAKTLKSAPGKQSTLDFEGKQGRIAMELLRNSTASSPDGAVTIKSVETYGREDHTAADIQGMRWRRQLLCSKGEGGKCLSVLSDPSQLLGPFLLGEKHQRITKLLYSHTIRLMEKPKKDSYSAIAARERNNKLNPSQAKAARAILSPLTSSISMTASNENMWQQEDRFVLVHGPPGTGKTSLITACCEQWQQSCSNMENEDEKARDTVYAVCQSNVAVKNIAESFLKAGINFKVRAGCGQTRCLSLILFLSLRS